MAITKIIGREILDSRGNPTVKADIALDHSPPADGRPEGQRPGTSEGAAAETRSSMRRLQFDFPEEAHRELEQLAQSYKDAAARCRAAEAALEELSMKQQAAEQELRNLRQRVSR